jgi:hypothetical protein
MITFCLDATGIVGQRPTYLQTSGNKLQRKPVNHSPTSRYEYLRDVY